MNWSLIKNIFLVRYRGLLRLRLASQPVHFECLGSACAKCCGVMGQAIVLSETEAETIGAATLTIENVHVMKAKSCACPLLKLGKCSVYAERPQGCQEYPWYNIGGMLYYDSGCPGFQQGRDSRPSPSELKPIEKYLPNLPNIFRSVLLGILKAW